MAPVLSLGLLLASTSLWGQKERKVTRLADGVYAIEHQGGPYVSGNTTVIIGERQVFVVDSCFLPSAAREDIAQIRQWTDKPVTFVLNTHFHNDHNFGNRIYMDAFPGLTIIAHAETKKEMDMFGPGSADRMEKGVASLQKMLETGKTPDGTALTEEDKTEVKNALAKRLPLLEEVKKVKFQSATLTFEHDFSIDLGGREVQVKFLGRGNTPGDAVVYLPKEKIVATGDLVVYPLPYMYDGYPREWIQTMQNLSQLDAETIVPGHGPVEHDKARILLIRDLMKSAIEQWNAKLLQTGPGMFRTLDEAKAAIDLTPFKKRFIGDDESLGPAWDNLAANLIKIVYGEASLR
jgi:glyoxylase-like metal-dependent hydrolase (beta-lactamase superfamily II)